MSGYRHMNLELGSAVSLVMVIASILLAASNTGFLATLWTVSAVVWTVAFGLAFLGALILSQLE